MPLFRRDPARDDPYWESFLNRPATDPVNVQLDLVRHAPEGQVFPVVSELHSPDVMSRHMKDFARFLGALMTGIVRLTDTENEFAIVNVVRAEHDPRDHPGIGGQAPRITGLNVTFNLGAVIRELGHKCSYWEADGDRLAAAAGLGRLDARGRLVTSRYGSKVYVADVLRTEMPLAPDGEAAST